MRKHHNRLHLGIFILLLLHLSNSVKSAGAFLLPDTGQTQCFNNKGKIKVISCPPPDSSLAQDGSYAINPPSYTVRGDGTVLDNNTNLIWEQDDGWRCVTSEEAKIYCEGLSLGGYDDWRLPTKRELESIVNYGQYSPAIDVTAFPTTKNMNYWTSTTDICNRGLSNFVGFKDGIDGEADPSNVNICTRCVRGERLPFARFADNHNGTVSDLSTGLVWQKDGMNHMKWDAALSYCEGLTLGACSDWRLPNVKELESLTFGIQDYAVPSNVLTIGTNFPYWSSTTYIGIPDYTYKWVMHSTGNLGFWSVKDRLSKNLLVRCVRGQEPVPIDGGKISVSPSSLRFWKRQDDGITSANIAISNLGNDDLVIDMIIRPSLPFIITSDECSGRTLGPLMSCFVTVTISGDDTGAFSDVLTVYSNDADHPYVNIGLKGSVMSAFYLSDTGQNSCYDLNGAAINCLPPGSLLAQDGSYDMNRMVFTVNNDGTVTDNNSHLVWQQQDDGISRTSEEAAEYCRNLNLAGRGNWRLPAGRELVGIVNYGRYNPSIDDSVFPDTKVNYYLSSTPGSYGDSSKVVNFNDGGFGTADNSAKYHVRCVIGAETSELDTLITNGNGTTSDLLTGLMWQQRDYVASNWEGALNYCENLSLGGYSDWRLPNLKELESIIDSRFRPAINPSFFPEVACGYWSKYWTSTSYTALPDDAHVVDFTTGSSGGHSYHKFYNNYNVRCVRGGIIREPTVITGTVTDAATGLPISAAVVTVTDSEKTSTALTDANGAYTITDVTPGSFTATYERCGYLTQIVNGTLSDGQTLVLDIQLILIDPLTVVITLPQDGSVVNTSAITVIGSVTNDGQVSVNGHQATVSDGAFTVVIFVKEGQNIITATATDQYGQTASHSITVTLAGLLDSQEIFVNPAGLNFGPINTRCSSSLIIAVSNIGTGNLLIGKIGSPSSPFLLSTDECSGCTLTESESCTLTVKFSPVSEGTYTDTLTIPSNDGDHPSIVVPLNGSSTLYQGAYFLPDTGQEECYDSQGNIIDCRYTGQDGEYRTNPLSYTANIDGTVEDNNTGLTWQQQDDDIQRTWADAVNYCDNLSLGGFTGWRLPTKTELLSLVDYGRFEPAIDLSIFPDTSATGYWSSTSALEDAWLVGFDYGEVSALNKSSLAHVRCVWGEQLSEGPFEDNGDGTVSDLSTGLMWMQYEIANTKDWATALSICENGTYAGYSDWRLPNIKELASLYANCYDWSSTTGTADHSQAYVIDSCSGLTGTHGKSSADHYVRCVRGGYTASGTITGIVTDASTGLSLQSAAVSVTDSSQTMRTALTGDNGRYVISGIESSNFSGYITKDGYNPYGFSGTMTPARTVIINAALSKSYTVTTLGDYGNVTVMEVAGDYDAKNPDGSMNTLPRQEIAKEFFRLHQDGYDFFVIFTNFDFAMPEASARGFYLEVKNDTQGIGKTLFDNSGSFGSNGKLQGIIEMGNISKHVLNPSDPKFEETILILAHEQMHRWGAQVKYKDANQNISTALLGKDGTHWSFLLDTDGSVLYGNDWRDNGDGTFTSAGTGKYYGALDLYLMGICDKSQVPPMLLIENHSIDPTRLPEAGATISGTSKTVAINDVIAAEGERIPNASTSQKSFKTAFIFLTRPGTFTGNELTGIESVRNAWAGKFSALTYGKGSIADVTPSLTIAIITPSDGETISRPDVTVTGTIINSAGNETGVTVNGIVATVYGDHFIVNHVPLTEGSNTITVTATDTAGNTATTSIAINAVTSGHYIRLTSNVESGIAPLETVLRMDGSFSFKESYISATGPIQPEVIESTTEECRLRFLVEGVYDISAGVTDSEGLLHEDTITIIVFNKTQMDNLLKGKWEGMKVALSNQNIEEGLNYFIRPSKEMYGQAFNILGDQLTQIVNDMKDIEMIYLFEDIAKFRINRTHDIDGTLQTITYYIYFLRDKNGVWKINRF